MPADALPEVVVPTDGDRRTAGVSQDLVARTIAATLVGVRDQVAHQRRRDRLPTYSLALLLKPDQALVWIKIASEQRKRAAAPAGGLDVQSQEETVKVGGVPGRRGHVDDLGELVAVQRPVVANRRGFGTGPPASLIKPSATAYL